VLSSSPSSYSFIKYFSKCNYTHSNEQNIMESAPAYSTITKWYNYKVLPGNMSLLHLPESFLACISPQSLKNLTLFGAMGHAYIKIISAKTKEQT